MKPVSLVRRLIWLAAGWSLVLLVSTGVALSLFFSQSAISRFDQSLTDLTDALYAGSTVDASGKLFGPTFTDSRALLAYSGKYWEIAEPAAGGKANWLVRSRSLWDSEMGQPKNIVAQLEADSNGTIFYDTIGPAKEPLRAAATIARLPGRTQPVIFMAAEDRRPVDRDVRRFALTRVLPALVILGAGLVAAVFIQVRIGLAPLFGMGREVAEVRQGKAQRLSDEYPKELAPLAGELNALLDHNQEVVERQRTHVGNLAHALKTPISVMLAEAERNPGALAGVVGRQAEAMRDHVEHHLRRARAAARSPTSGERTELEPVLDELARTLERIFRGEVAIDWDCDPDLCFAGERQDLMELAGNVMENACKWSRGKVRVRAVAVPDRPRLTITVEDNGPGLPPDQRETVVKRGARLDENAPGSGLGLSIVDELARAYGGTLGLSDSSLGGLKASLELPRAEG
jgi:signal transduction histidine kinase